MHAEIPNSPSNTPADHIHGYDGPIIVIRNMSRSPDGTSLPSDCHDKARINRPADTEMVTPYKRLDTSSGSVSRRIVQSRLNSSPSTYAIRHGSTIIRARNVPITPSFPRK